MPALTSLALGALAISGASTVAQIAGANSARNDAKAAADQQAQQQTTLEKQANDQKTTMAANEERDRQRARQKAMSANAGGRADTILTSPLGDISSPGAPGGAGGKTLLGL